MNFHSPQNSLNNQFINNPNNHDLFDSFESLISINSPTLNNIDNSIYFCFISKKSEGHLPKVLLSILTQDQENTYSKFEKIIISDFNHQFRLQKLNTINSISYSNSNNIHISRYLNILLYINQTEDDHLYKPKTVFKKNYFNDRNKDANFKRLNDLFFSSIPVDLKTTKAKLLTNIIQSGVYPSFQINIIHHILHNNTTFPSNTYLIPLKINFLHNCFLKMPKEFEIIEFFFLKDLVAHLNLVNFQMSNIDDLQDPDKYVYRITRNTNIPVRFPVWLIKETYLSILSHLCEDADLQKFFITFFYKFISGNNICYNLPDGGTYKRHINNLKKSKCHNHNMSRFEIIEFLDSEFTRVIMKISYFLILIEFCRDKQIIISRLFYSENEDIVLVVKNNALLKQDIMECFKQVFYMDDDINGLENMFNIH